MTKMSCTEAFKRLDDFLDHELSEGELAQVEEHLSTCRMCAEEFGVEQTLLDMIREKLRRGTAPPGLRERIAKALGA